MVDFWLGVSGRSDDLLRGDAPEGLRRLRAVLRGLQRGTDVEDGGLRGRWRPSVGDVGGADYGDDGAPRCPLNLTPRTKRLRLLRPLRPRENLSFSLDEEERRTWRGGRWEAGAALLHGPSREKPSPGTISR